MGGIYCMYFLNSQHYWSLSCLFKIPADVFHVVLGLESLPWLHLNTYELMLYLGK